MKEVLKNVCEVVLIRHGETNWNKERRLQGNLDIPLNDTGRKQMQELSNNLWTQIESTPGVLPLLTPKCTALIASPLSRAAESAQILADSLGFNRDQIVYESDLMEWNAGELQGLYLSEVQEKCPEAYQAWRLERNPFYDFNGGESFADRHERVVRAVQGIANRFCGQRVIVVTHSGVIDEVFRRAKRVPLKNPTRAPKLNAGLYIVHVQPETLMLSATSSLSAASTRSTASTEMPTETSKAGNEEPASQPRDFPRWKLLRWGLQKIRDGSRLSESSIDVTWLKSELAAAEIHTTEYV